MKSYPQTFQRIWDACSAIPKGKAATYQYLAQKIGSPRGSRVVGMAMARNPYAPKVPCHRVVRSDGSLGGYSAPGGLKTKMKILKREGVQFDPNGRVSSRFILK